MLSLPASVQNQMTSFLSDEDSRVLPCLSKNRALFPNREALARRLVNHNWAALLNYKPANESHEAFSRRIHSVRFQSALAASRAYQEYGLRGATATAQIAHALLDMTTPLFSHAGEYLLVNTCTRLLDYPLRSIQYSIPLSLSGWTAMVLGRFALGYGVGLKLSRLWQAGSLRGESILNRAIEGPVSNLARRLTGSAAAIVSGSSQAIAIAGNRGPARRIASFLRLLLEEYRAGADLGRQLGTSLCQEGTQVLRNHDTPLRVISALGLSIGCCLIWKTLQCFDCPSFRENSPYIWAVLAMNTINYPASAFEVSMRISELFVQMLGRIGETVVIEGCSTALGALTVASIQLVRGVQTVAKFVSRLLNTAQSDVLFDGL